MHACMPAPHSDEAVVQGCTCPDPDDPRTYPAAMVCGHGLMFDPRCPVHRDQAHALIARIFGRLH